MDDKRKRYVVAGVIVGTVAVGLVVLARRTPRDKWASTLMRIAKDGLGVIKSRYGDNEVVSMVERSLDRFHDNPPKMPGGA